MRGKDPGYRERREGQISPQSAEASPEPHTPAYPTSGPDRLPLEPPTSLGHDPLAARQRDLFPQETACVNRVYGRWDTGAEAAITLNCRLVWAPDQKAL